MPPKACSLAKLLDHWSRLLACSSRQAPTVGSLRTEKGLAELNELLSSRWAKGPKGLGHGEFP